jgi:hypothetical protein
MHSACPGRTHPTYKALAELGKAMKPIFLCRYLQSLELRREINEGLNVVEHWNSATNFILYGKGGEFATHRREDQETDLLDQLEGRPSGEVILNPFVAGRLRVLWPAAAAVIHRLTLRVVEALRFSP